METRHLVISHFWASFGKYKLKNITLLFLSLQGLSKTTENLQPSGLEVQLEFGTRLEFWRHIIFGYQTAFRLSMQGNSWIWKINNMNILVDPVLVGNLDFGIPFLYDAAKKSKIMKEFTVIPRFFSPEAYRMQGSFRWP